MAKQKLEAGGVFDILTHDELNDALDNFVIKLGQGVKFRRVITYFDVAANQVRDTAGIGPEPGFIWDVRLIHGDTSTAAVPGTILTYMGSVSPVNLVDTQSGAANTQGQTFNKHIILHPGENLIFQLTGATIASPLQLATAVHVIEVPIFHEGQLLL